MRRSQSVPSRVEHEHVSYVCRTTTQENCIPTSRMLNFPHANLRKEIRTLTLPIFIELLLVTLMGATDTFMLSQYADDAVAAVGVLFGWLFGHVFGWGLVGMWWAFVLDEGIRGTIFIFRWRSKRWQQRAFI